MDVFQFCEKLVQDYASYIQSFINIRDVRIREQVEEELKKGLLWPEPLIQLNPSFEPGNWVDELVREGVLHPECRRIFRLHKDRGPGEDKPLLLHRHQSDAIRTASTGANYVLTTGTGSGKSLAYIVPIVDHVLRNGSGNGIQAIVVYPMNALANSQYGELEKFLKHGYPNGKGPVTFARYTGQESDDERREIVANPPDILLTNYVMLELILTRPYERGLIKAAQGLQFLVLDELHTYRGRQGADVALLVRRVRDQLNASNLQCIGTSATLATEGTFAERQAAVAAVASRLFGAVVEPENVIGETLRRSTPDRRNDDPDFVRALTERVSDTDRKPPTRFNDFIEDPLSIWIESTFGVLTVEESGRLERTVPRGISGDEGAAKELSDLTGIDEKQCARGIQKGLLAGYRCEPNPDTGFRPFAFRLHQFISRGDTVFASLEPEDKRYITVHGQRYVPGDRSKVLLPLAFCRECGQPYYTVRRGTDQETHRAVFAPRDLTDSYNDDEGESGFLYISSDTPWPDDHEELLRRVPDDWVEEHNGVTRIRATNRKYLPERIYIGTDGLETPGGGVAHYFAAPFRFCLHCGVSYDARQRSDFGKLATLGSEGRSTATTILSLSAILELRESGALTPRARKLLSFTDNRQDASLQAGHFNDFVEIGTLRASLYRAVVDAGAKGIEHDELTERVFKVLDLPIEEYASDPTVMFLALANTQKALRNVLGYRLYRDLKRGWRVTAPNLEQTGLLEIKYQSLDDLCAHEPIWTGTHPALENASPETRQRISKTLLDYMRRELAIKVDYLDTNFQSRIEQQSNQHLIAPWALDENESFESASIAFPRSKRPGDFGGHTFISPRGGFGQYLGRSTTFPDYGVHLPLTERQEIIEQLLGALRQAGLVEVVQEPGGDGEVPGYQVPAAAMLWVAGDGTTPFYDPIRVPSRPESGGRTNAFFVEYYRNVANRLRGIEAREHTAQVPYEDRVDREQRFREARLPILYCSPTMELGVDISELNVVNMRNVPPTPANYSQRSGRAGRSGQPALVFSYCSTGSSHDQYFFRRPERMVAGAVTPPRLDLSNEDLVRAHIQAIWLTETGMGLGQSLQDLLDLSGDNPTLKLLDSVRDQIRQKKPRERAAIRARRVLATFKEELEDSDWYSEGWLDEVLTQVALNFDQACDRWRGLYRSAHKQAKVQASIILDATRSYEEKQQAVRLRREAEEQLALLTQVANVVQSDFYSYRYFASEGFLPGYNFPRLPLSAYIPARRGRQHDEFLSRPRFLAISEFGPRAIVYHEGSRYIINKVILPVGDDDVLTRRAKRCEACGYLHPLVDGTEGFDLCERCGAELGMPYTELFRLQNVSTKRRDRINSDEEERMRLGYEIISGARFTEKGGWPLVRTAKVESTTGSLAKLTYGHAATLWRINLGWSRRKNREQYGFVLDTERGYWARNEQVVEDQDDPMSQKTKRVIPYVEDRRNCLIFEPSEQLKPEVIISLQSALKNAIQVQYQLEDDELHAEPLPGRDDPKMILLYEASEGGAGVLRQLLDDPGAFARVAQEALRICHFDPGTGKDKGRAPHSREDCEAACYDCLMSYRNQRDHAVLDRKLIQPLLLACSQARVSASPTARPRAAHLESLMRQCDSELEKKWLQLLDENDYRLPSKAQPLIASCNTRPDFLYEDERVAIYIDGAPHDYPERQARDKMQNRLMDDYGYTVIRFHHEDDWPSIFAKYPYIFGNIT